MTYREILNSAISAVCEDTSAAGGTEDYTYRGQYLLATFVVEQAPLDAQYRRANGLPAAKITTDMVSVDPEDDFPLCNTFMPAAVNYLASALVIDENEEMSDRFFDRFVNNMLTLKQSIPATQEKIKDCYALN